MRKYLDLSEEINQLYRVETSGVLPVIISGNELIPEATVETVKEMDVPSKIMEAQKAVLLGTASIVRKF